MPISDTYIVQYLLQETRDGGACLHWRENGSHGYTARIRGMRVELAPVHSRAGSWLYLSISCGQGDIQIQEPPNIGLFREKYRSEEERRLAELMNELARSAGRQCEDRRHEFAAGSEQIRQTLYRRLIGAYSTGD